MSSINTSLSAIQAATTLLNVSADNTSNINTDGYKKVNATVNEGVNGGVVVTLGENENTGPAYQVQTTAKPNPSNTDLVEEKVAQLSAQNMFETNLKALQATDEMEGSLIETIA